MKNNNNMNEAFSAAQSAVDQVSEAMSALKASSSVIDALESLKTEMAKEKHLFTNYEHGGRSSSSSRRSSGPLPSRQQPQHDVTPAHQEGATHRRNDTFSEGYHRAHAADYEARHEFAAGEQSGVEHSADVELATGERARHTERRHFGGLSLGVASNAVASADMAMEQGNSDGVDGPRAAGG